MCQGNRTWLQKLCCFCPVASLWKGVCLTLRCTCQAFQNRVLPALPSSLPPLSVSHTHARTHQPLTSNSSLEAASSITRSFRKVPRYGTTPCRGVRVRLLSGHSFSLPSLHTELSSFTSPGEPSRGAPSSPRVTHPTPGARPWGFLGVWLCRGLQLHFLVVTNKVTGGGGWAGAGEGLGKAILASPA